jgi:hypothetical protein
VAKQVLSRHGKGNVSYLSVIRGGSVEKLSADEKRWVKEIGKGGLKESPPAHIEERLWELGVVERKEQDSGLSLTERGERYLGKL